MLKYLRYVVPPDPPDRMKEITLYYRNGIILRFIGIGNMQYYFEVGIQGELAVAPTEHPEIIRLATTERGAATHEEECVAEGRGFDEMSGENPSDSTCHSSAPSLFILPVLLGFSIGITINICFHHCFYISF